MTFKVGDRVKVIGKRSDAGRHLFGREGTIIKVSGSDIEEYWVHLDIEKELYYPHGGLWATDIEYAQTHLNEQEMRKLLGVQSE